jgi:hypothetical protein
MLPLPDMRFIQEVRVQMLPLPDMRYIRGQGSNV